MTSEAVAAAKATIGEPGSRALIPTPALVLDLDAFERNVARMAEHCKVNGLSIRPHAKTHKSVAIAKAQVAAGALGVCCAKLGEAEAMAAGGIESILITSPVVTAQGLDRLMTLNAKIPDLMVVADHPDNARALAAAASEAKRTLKVLVDLDVGLHRTGIRPGDEATDLAELLDAAEFLELRGLQAYAGHLMHIHDFAERREKSLAAMKVLGDQRDALKAKGLCCDIVSGGGTGTYNIDPEATVLTELQGGSYIFMDKQYNDVALGNGASFPFETSLFVQMSVVSNNTKNLATTDAGFKSFSTDAASVRCAGGRGLFLLRRRTGRHPAARRRASAIRQCTDGHDAALRPDGEPLRFLSCREGRPAGRYLAHRGARTQRLRAGLPGPSRG